MSLRRVAEGRSRAEVPTRRPRAAAVAWSITAVAVMLLAGLASTSAGALAGTSSAAHSALTPSAGAATQALDSAAASLATGAGPAGGQPLTCGAPSDAGQSWCTLSSSDSSGIPTPGTAPGNVGNQKWESEVAPSARTGASMTYDGKDRYVVLFGGFNGTAYLADTWIWSHSMWVEVAPAQSPSARANASMTYDPVDKYVVLFGGYNGAFLSDTWKYVGGAWSQIVTTTAPSPRDGAAFSNDTRDGYLVLFGGRSSGGALGDTWTFLKGVWTNLGSIPSPSPRWSSAVTFDATDNYLLLFGGFDGTSLLGDTWSFAGGSWSQLSPSASPGPRYQSGMTFDAATGSALLFGGASSSTTGWAADGDTWTYAAGTWTQVVPAPGVHPPGGKNLPYGAPAARQAFALAYSPQTKGVVLFGGIADGDPLVASPNPNTQFYGPTDTWSYSSAGWSQVLSEQQSRWAEMPGRVGASIAYDPTAAYDVGTTPSRGYAVAFGGSTAYGPNGETWIFLSKPTAIWSETFPVTSPSARSYASMAYDPTDGYVLLFGGMSATGAALGDTWSFQSGAWTQLTPTNAPSARFGAMLTYDNATGSLVLFGGTDGTSYLGDTWSFSGGSWTQVAPAHAPPARAFGGLAWDEKTLYPVLFGGLSAGGALGDTWKFTGGSWTQVKPTTAPSASWGMTMVDNTKSQVVFLFGGCTALSFNPLAPTCPASDTIGTPWQYHAGWSVLNAGPRLTAVPATPEARFLAAGVSDPTAPTNVVLLFDGMTDRGAIVTDRWSFQSNIWNPWAPPVTPVARYGAASVYDDRSQNMLLFGGIGPVSSGGTAYLNDTWEWDSGIWGAATPASAPSARAFSGIGYFGTMKELKTPTSYNFTVLFGGVGPHGYLGDTWRWVGSETGGSWTNVTPATSPSARANVSMAYDNADNEVVLFGGQNGAGYLGDTWIFSDQGVWTQLSPSTSPSPRAGAAMVYDSEDGYLLLFGGVNQSGALGDTWTFLHGVWSQLTPTMAPSARFGAGIVDCPKLLPSGSGEPQVVLLVGGTNGSSYLGDTWVFLNGVWTLLAATTPGVTPFAFGAMSNDLDDGHASLFGGITTNGIPGAFWEFKLGS